MNAIRDIAGILAIVVLPTPLVRKPIGMKILLPLYYFRKSL
jgi:hypothetical protein